MSHLNQIGVWGFKWLWDFKSIQATRNSDVTNKAVHDFKSHQLGVVDLLTQTSGFKKSLRKQYKQKKESKEGGQNNIKMEMEVSDSVTLMEKVDLDGTRRSRESQQEVALSMNQLCNVVQ
ncbi:hypothetical protein VNO80_16263 [Phaseolus coccineus]|uniref:Uncharacterized protein n=1 Tax=Phaseolus coccineus TaxID=3886 RepID=A0AAN9MM52_PHACN